MRCGGHWKRSYGNSYTGTKRETSDTSQGEAYGPRASARPYQVEERLSIRHIVERLNQRGYRPHTSIRWAKSSVSRILRNELYIGMGFYNRRQRVEPEQPRPGFRRNKKTIHRWRPKTEWISQAAPAIVDQQVYQAAQEQLKLNSAHCCGRPPKSIYLLRGILRCSKCGRKHVGVQIFGDKYYRCTGRDRLAQPRCNCRVIAAEKLEGFVWNYVVSVLLNPKLLAQKLAIKSTDARDLNDELGRSEDRLSEVRRKQEKLLEAMLDDTISLPGMREKAAELDRQRADAETVKRQIQASIAVRRDQTQLQHMVFRYCRILGGGIGNLGLEAKQKLLRALIDEVTLNGDQVSLKGILPASLPRVNRPQRQDVVATRGGDFQSAFRHCLSAYIAEIRQARVGVASGVPRGYNRMKRLRGIQKLNDLGQMPQPENPNTLRYRSLGGIIDR